MVIANLPRMLLEITSRLIDHQEDMTLVRFASPTERLSPSALIGLDADVLLAPADGDPRAVACAYLAELPRLRVICFADDHRSAHHFHVAPGTAADGRASFSVVEEPLARLDRAHLIRVIRGVHGAG